MNVDVGEPGRRKRGAPCAREVASTELGTLRAGEDEAIRGYRWLVIVPSEPAAIVRDLKFFPESSLAQKGCSQPPANIGTRLSATFQP